MKNTEIGNKTANKNIKKTVYPQNGDNSQHHIDI